MKSNRINFFLNLALVSTLLLLAGCGGGSSGTGVPDSFIGKVLTGSVTDESNAPVVGAEVKVIETGSTTTTDTAGEFSIDVPLAGDINLQLAIGETTNVVPVSTEDAEGGRASVKIKVNRRKQVVGFSDLQITAKIVGRCDVAFENNSVIRQGNALKANTLCPVRVTVRSGKQPISGIPFRIEHKACAAHAPWRKIQEELTGPNGVGEGSFRYFDTDEFCDYRIIAPYKVRGIDDIIFPVRTFRRQKIDAEGAL